MIRIPTTRFLGIVAILAVSGACGGASSHSGEHGDTEARSSLARDEAPVVSEADAAALRDGNAAFATDLYRTLAPTLAGRNLFFSPHSISTALAMAYVGARGSTATQMASALHFTLPNDRLHPAFDALDLALSSRGDHAPPGVHPFALRVVSSTWAADDMTLTPTFLDTLATSYGAGVRLTDFASDPAAARARINGWVSDETEKKIPALLSDKDIEAATRLVLVNAVYFTAGWATPFTKSATTPGPFHAPGGDTSANMMHASGSIAYAEGSGWKAVALPYAGNQLSFVAVVPDDLAAFETSMTGDALEAIAPVPPLSDTEIDLALPKFKIDKATFELSEALRARGMVDAFDGSADFSGMTSDAVSIKKVVHQAFIDVDEDGTEAAASTAVVFGDGGVTLPPAKKVDVTFDKPFVFFIRDDATGALLFLGRVASP